MGSAGGEKAIARELMLKVAMHCRCEGCTPKVRSALNNLTQAPGVVAVLERSATEDTEEVRLLATADPERLRKSLHKATGKKEVDLVLIPPKPNKQERSGRWSGGKEDPRLVDFTTVQGLLADPQLHDQAPPPGHPWYGGSYVEGYLSAIKQRRTIRMSGKIQFKQQPGLDASLSGPLGLLGLNGPLSPEYLCGWCVCAWG